jgi:hypothetical protein
VPVLKLTFFISCLRHLKHHPPERPSYTHNNRYAHSPLDALTRRPAAGNIPSATYESQPCQSMCSSVVAMTHNLQTGFRSGVPLERSRLSIGSTRGSRPRRLSSKQHLSESGWTPDVRFFGPQENRDTLRQPHSQCRGGFSPSTNNLSS